MTRITITDPALPNLSLLFHGESMGELLNQQLGSAGVEITSVRPTYVRYKPETSCLVAYEMVLDVNGQELTVHGHIRTFADDRGERRMHRKRLRKILERRQGLHGAFPVTLVLYLEEVNGMFSFFPVDYELRPLVDVASATAMQQHLGKMLGQPDLALSQEPQLIRYKPGRKALFRYDLTAGDGRVLYAKVHTDDRAGMIQHATKTLTDAGFNTPEVVGIDPELALIVHAEAPGTQLASLRGDARYSRLLAELAEPLALLHRTPVDGLPVHHLGNEVDRLWETARLLGVILPKQQDRLQRIVCVLEDRLARTDDKLATNHGDFYDDQAIVDDTYGDSIAIIDLDEIRLAHPMLDIGNMLAHVRTGEQRGSVPADARPSFIDAMRNHREMSDRDLATFEAIGILKLTPGPFRRLEEGWPERIGAMIETIEETLSFSVPPHLVCGATTPETSSGGTEESHVRDEKLPELPALQDVTRMQAELRGVTGDTSLRLERIHVQRHKPGRRAIIRYDIANGEPIWGKIFASKRGPRVHEITRQICEARAFGPEVALPDPIAFLADVRVFLQRSVPGEPLGANTIAARPRLMDVVAEAIHTFHVSGLDLGRDHDLDKEMSPLHQRVDDVRLHAPRHGDEAMALYARILDLAGTVQGWRYLPIHRDFYHDQVLVDGDRLSILDLDDAAMSEPAVDIANFTTHLDLLALQEPEHAGEIVAMKNRFLARSRELDPARDELLVTFLTASTALRLAGIHVSRADGGRIAKKLLDVAGAALQASV